MPVLEVSRLSRDYRTRRETIHALRDVDLVLDEGEIVGLLGLNGAGKTTMLKVISTLLLPTSGSVRVDGFDVVSDTREVRSRLSVVLGGERGFYNRLSGRDNIRFFGLLSGLSRHDARAKGDEGLERVGLAEAADRPVETYSKGMKQRLHLAVGLLTTPRLLLLDEPTVGLDPLEAQRVRDSIAELRGTRVAVLLTSHYLGDIERLAERVVILQRGVVTHDLPLERLLERAGAAAEVTLTGVGAPPSEAELERAAERSGVRLLGLASLDGGRAGWTLTFEVNEWSGDSFRALGELWPDREITDVRVQPVTLETVFSELARAEEGLAK
jgi:ABC-2 type transport system ATP-binding protein